MTEDLENKDRHIPAIPAAVSDFLPYKDKTGKLIHVVYLKNKFYCSQAFFERLLTEEPDSILQILINAKA